jgi:hypothetical protein
MKSIQLAAAVAVLGLAASGAFAQKVSGSGYSAPGAPAPIRSVHSSNSGAGYSAPGAPAADVDVIVLTPVAPSSSSTSSSGTSSSDNSNVTVVGFTTDNPPLSRDDVKVQAAQMNAVRGTASGENPAYPQREQRLLGTSGY